MTEIGTPGTKTATKLVLLGSGELGKEVAIEAQRYGIHVIAIDRYANAPAMQVAHESFVVDMLDSSKLKELLENIRPNYIVPEIEAIATEVLLELEEKGFTVVPTARAVNLTMNRENIRCFAAEELNLKTSAYRFASIDSEIMEAIQEIGYPCIIKPIMSSSGKGQSLIKTEEDIEPAIKKAREEARNKNQSRVIIEELIEFDYEITQLTISHINGISFLEPIGHLQLGGDYVESWQSQEMDPDVLEEVRRMAESVVQGLGGRGVFGVEFFIKGKEVFFSEVSPRPHDTGLVTLISSNHSQFSLHVRAVLGLPMPKIHSYTPAASYAILLNGMSMEPVYQNINLALSEPDTALRLFGKPGLQGRRRMGVALALGESLEDARKKAKNVASYISIQL